MYSFAVSALLGRLGEQRMMLGGGATLAAALLIIALGLPWPVECLAFTMLGLGFYSLHGVIQIYSTELAPQSRGLAMSLHSSFFFLGQALGPIAYRYGLASIGSLGRTRFPRSRCCSSDSCARVICGVGDRAKSRPDRGGRRVVSATLPPHSVPFTQHMDNFALPTRPETARANFPPHPSTISGGPRNKPHAA
ncbi:MAG: hypothetical protein ACXW3N_11025 [Rhodoplanes sp.]